MKSLIFLFLAAVLMFGPTPSSFADDDSDQNQQGAVEVDKSKWHDQIKEKYSLSDEDMKKLEDSGMNHAQQAKAAHLASKSDKSLDEVLKMRIEDKMGWGQIAKSLGVHPGELGKANEGLNRSADRRAERAERREAKMKRRAERREAKAERKARGPKKK